MTKVNKLSERLLLAVKMNQATDDLLVELESLYLDDLENDLNNDDHKKAFWINLYNAAFQILRKIKKVDKSNIYTGKFIDVAAQKLSLDDIEHGILRKYRYKFSLGYLPNPFAPSLIKKLAVSKVDYRIHFALNCGAASCPPIAFYTADKIESQLTMATSSFLEGETEVKEEAKEIHISRLFQWFRGDFGGTKGIRKVLEKQLQRSTKGYRLVYTKYSWEEQLDNYSPTLFE